MDPRVPTRRPEPVPGTSTIRRKVGGWGAAVVALILSPSTLVLVVSGPLGTLALMWLAFVWGFTSIGYFLGVWYCVEAERKGMNGLVWGLFLAGPWWPLVLVIYAFSSQGRPVAQPRA